MAKAVITDKAPKPKRRRRKRDEDTRGLFKKLAMKILAAVALDTKSALEKSPMPKAINEPDPWYMPPVALDDTQRLLTRERHRQDVFRQQQHNQAFHYNPPNHLFPPL